MLDQRIAKQTIENPRFLFNPFCISGAEEYGNFPVIADRVFHLIFQKRQRKVFIWENVAWICRYLGSI
jgi:hypothetical protein